LVHQNPIGGVKPAEKETLNPSSLIGQTAPEWKLPILGKDEILSDKDLLGKYILLEFTATWCSSCIPAAEMMNRLEDKLKSVENVAIVSIFSSRVDTKDGILKFVEKNNLRSTVLYSATEVEKKYHISSYPNFLIVSPKGKVLIYYHGFNETVEKNIFSMLSEFADLKDNTIKEGPNITDSKSKIASFPSGSVKPDTSAEEHTPMYILDGEIVDKTQINAVNPNDIKSVSILRDKSATDKYGEKAKNGVLLMVTKKKDSEANKNIDVQKF
jgi:thiol-disulfide isomerase/thioredoxin